MFSVFWAVAGFVWLLTGSYLYHEGRDAQKYADETFDALDARMTRVKESARQMRDICDMYLYGEPYRNKNMPDVPPRVTRQ